MVVVVAVVIVIVSDVVMVIVIPDIVAVTVVSVICSLSLLLSVCLLLDMAMITYCTTNCLGHQKQIKNKQTTKTTNNKIKKSH